MLGDPASSERGETRGPEATRARRLLAGLIALGALLVAQSVLAGLAPPAHVGGAGTLTGVRRAVWGLTRPAAVHAPDGPARLVGRCTAPPFARAYAATYAARTLAGGRAAAILIDPAAGLIASPFERIAGPVASPPDGGAPAADFHDALVELPALTRQRGAAVLPAIAPRDAATAHGLVLRYDAHRRRVLVEPSDPSRGAPAP